MGLYTDVKIYKAHLPVEFRELDGWQTKDVVNPELGTLKITKKGKLTYTVRNVFTGQKIYNAKLAFTGEMVFYTDTGDVNGDDYVFIELKAKFKNGKLKGIEYEPIYG